MKVWKRALLALLMLPLVAGRAAPHPGVRVAALEAPALPSNVEVMAWPGGIGIPKVITWASTAGDSGIAWGTTSQITGANASITYNATSMLLNVPAGKSFAFKINAATQLTVKSTGVLAFAGGGAPTSIDYGIGATSASLFFQGAPADGPTAIANVINTGSAFATAGAKLLSIQNALSEKFAFKWDSGLTFSTTIAPAAADYGISQDGSNLILNAPTAKGISLAVNGASQFKVTASNTITAQVAAATTIANVNGQNLVVTDGTNTLATIIDAGTTGDVVASRGIGISGTNPTTADLTAPAGQGIVGPGPTRVFEAQSSAGATTIRSSRADAAAAIGFIFDNSATLATTGAKLLSLQNNGNERFSVDFKGGANFTTGTGVPASTQLFVANDGSNDLILNAPSGKITAIQVAGVSSLQVAANTITVGQSGTGTTINQSGNSGSLTISSGTVAGNQVIVTDSAGVAVFAVGTLGNGSNGVRGSTSQNLRIQSGATKDLYLNASTSDAGHLSVGDSYTDELKWNASGVTIAVTNYYTSATSSAITADAGAIDTTKRFQLIKPTANSAVTILSLTGGVAGEEICIIGDTTGGGASTTLAINSTSANTVDTFRARVGGSVNNTLGNNARASFGCYVYGALDGEANAQWWEM